MSQKCLPSLLLVMFLGGIKGKRKSKGRGREERSRLERGERKGEDLEEEQVENGRDEKKHLIINTLLIGEKN